MSVKITKEDIQKEIWTLSPLSGSKEEMQKIVDTAIERAIERGADREFDALMEHLNLIFAMDLKPVLCICNTGNEILLVDKTLRKHFGEEIDCVRYGNYEVYAKYPKDNMEYDIWHYMPQYIIVTASMCENYKNYLKECTTIPIYFYEDKVTKKRDG